MVSLVPVYFNPKRALFHYLGIAKGAFEYLDSEGKISIKKLFYVLRPLVAGLWIDTFATMPPTDFHVMCAAEGLLDEPMQEAIRALYHQKLDAPEGFLVTLESGLHDWILRTRAALESAAASAGPGRVPGLEPLDAIMLRFTEGWGPGFAGDRRP